MKYFIDTEFKEKPGTIQLISIGIVAEDGREYYAISKDFNLREVWNDDWLRNNVLLHIHTKYSAIYPEYSRRSLKKIIQFEGKSNKQIAQDIINFVNPEEPSYQSGIGLDQVIYSFTRADAWSSIYYPKEFEYIAKHNTFIPEKAYSSGFDGRGADRNRALIYNQPNFYGYYADYDWVVFCWLFGRMTDLPKGFPKYCRDLKQTLDWMGLTGEWKKEHCPDPEGEHDALVDARWTKLLHDEIIKLP
jgi:hypothetical protein